MMMHMNEPEVVQFDLTKNQVVTLTDEVNHIEVHGNMAVHVVAKETGGREPYRLVSTQGNYVEVLDHATQRYVRLNTSDEYLFAATVQGVPIVHVGAGNQFLEAKRDT